MEPWSARTVSHFLACASGYYRKHIMATKPSYRWFNPLLAAILSLLAMRGGFAAPPDFAQVPAEIDWFVHVDIDALHNSTALPQIFKKACARWKSIAVGLDNVKQQYGMDLAKDLHSMTVYGPRLSQRRAVLIMRADWAEETFRRKLAVAPNHTAVMEGPYEIHRFTQKDRGHVRPVTAALWKQGTFVFGQAADEVKFSLEVLDGKRPNLSGSDALLAAAPPAGTILVARMVCVGDRLPVESPLLKQTEHIDFVCGENAGKWFIHAKLQAKSPEAAQQVKQVAEGLLAMARLRLAGDADSLKLLDRAELRVDKQTVELDFRARRGRGPNSGEGHGAPLIMQTLSDYTPSNEDLAARRSRVVCRVSKNFCGGSRSHCCTSCGASGRNTTPRTSCKRRFCGPTGA